MAGKYQRKKFFFKKSPQGRYIFSYFLIAGVISFSFTILFVYFSSDTLSITYNNNDLQLGDTPEILLNKLLGINGVLIFIFGLFIIYFATRFTHRTIGPLYKIETTIDKMIDGDINRQIFLRQKDDCKDLAKKLNSFNTIMYSRLKEIETIVNDLKLTLENKTLLADSKENAKEYVELHHITALSDRLEKVLAQFNLSGDIPEP